MGYSPARIQEHDKIQIARMVSMGMAPLGMSPMVGIVAKKVLDIGTSPLASAAGGIIAKKVLDKVAPDAIKSFVPNLVPPMNRMPGGGMPIRFLR
jgi:hypothetical protein